jgi:excisionase family DNA binding protein
MKNVGSLEIDTEKDTIETMDGFFSSGETARQLGVTQAKIRALCEAGAIEATKTPGGQWRVAADEVEKLQNDGLPPLPHQLPEARENSPSSNTRPRGKLLAEPSAGLIASRENVEELRHQLEAMGLRQRLRESEDWFVERDVRAAQEQAGREREENERRAKQEAERTRVKWSKNWECYALRALPRGFDSETKLQIHREMRSLLENLDPIPADAVVKKLVDGLVAQAVKPWRRREEKKKAIERAVDSLPWDLRYSSEWQETLARAIKAATIAVNESAGDQCAREAAALAAMRPIVDEYEHLKKCMAVASDLVQRLSGSTAEERQGAAKTVISKLVQMPIGTGANTMKTAGEKLLLPLQDKIAKREQAEREQRSREQEEREQTRKSSAAQLRADLSLGRVHDFLREREHQGQIEFSGFSEMWNIGEAVRKRIRPFLIQELIQRPDLSQEKLHRRIDVLVNQYLGEFLDD